MRRHVKSAVLAGVLLALAACAQPQNAGSYGPGGPAMMGAGWGHGPGMMMGGGPGWGYGPGMMGGPGMMMGGAGMFWGLERLDLSPPQRERIAQIQDEARTRMQAFWEAMHTAGGPMDALMGGTALDDAAARQAYERMSTLHRQMFDAQMQTRRQMLEVLTPAQREQLERAWRGPR